VATVPALHDVLRALRGGPATLDALSARLGGTDRDTLLWAVGEGTDRGLIAANGDVDCGPDGLCGTSAPLVCSLTPSGRDAAAG
jgi:hypothetical protein